jgi:hypothetical protein
MTIADLIASLKNQSADSAFQRSANGNTQFKCVSEVSELSETIDTIKALIPGCPSDLIDLWLTTQSATLFQDVEYGQWGLDLLSPGRSVAATIDFRSKRTKDFLDGDCVVGVFLGDSDLLLVRCDPLQKDYGSVLVALPIDQRQEWYQVATSLSDFLAGYIAARGGKFWEAG